MGIFPSPEPRASLFSATTANTSSTTCVIALPVVSITLASGRRIQGRGGARAIELVARSQRRRHFGNRRRAAGMGGVERAAPRAFFRRRIEIDLHVGAGKHHRADVAALHHDRAVDAQRALPADQLGTHARQASHGCGRAIDFRRADRARHVDAVDEHVRPTRSRCAPVRRCARRPASSSSATLRLERLPADRAVHRPAVDVAVPERRRHRARDGSLARAGRPVDRDRERAHEFVRIPCTSGPESAWLSRRSRRARNLTYSVLRVPS